LKALPSKHCIVKFGNVRNLQEEYDASLVLKDYTNFIQFYCFFSCPESFQEVIHRNYATHPRICFSSGKDAALLGGIVMPYYPKGSINQYPWKRKHLPIFYNILCQVCFALANAYAQTGFVHNDLHADNVLIKITKKQTLTYGSAISLPVLNGYYAVLMDLEHPKKDDPVLFTNSLNRIITTSCTAEKSDFVLEHTPSNIRAWFQTYPTWNPEAAQALHRLIHSIPLSYVKSERPAFPSFTNSRR
jgi:serine/threonine protein kinase